MADSDIQITAGTGTKVDTRTVGAGSDEHRQVMCIGDPSTAAQVAAVSAQNAIQITGDLADGTTDSGTNPIKIGAWAEQNLASSAVVTDGQRTNIHADIDGVLYMKPCTSYGDIIVTRVTDTAGTSTAFTAFPATASRRNYLSTITVYNSSTTSGFLDIRDGTAGTILYTIPLPALGGATINFPVPLRQTTVNTALAYDVSAALTTVYISAVGFQSQA